MPVIGAYSAGDWAAVALMALLVGGFIGALVFAVRRTRAQTGLRGWKLAWYILGIVVPVLIILIAVRACSE
jgi:hypothetical protein